MPQLTDVLGELNWVDVESEPVLGLRVAVLVVSRPRLERRDLMEGFDAALDGVGLA